MYTSPLGILREWNYGDTFDAVQPKSRLDSAQYDDVFTLDIYLYQKQPKSKRFKIPISKYLPN